MENQVSGEIKEERSNILIELSEKNEKEYLDKCINEEMEVLFEEKEDGYIKGHTTNYLIVKSKNENSNENEIRKVRIIQRDGLELIGK